ncbi:Uncharacterised protein [Streptococcus pneumoniae]|nr:Uncharacterised protein [Streptococcus pneumoniae]
MVTEKAFQIPKGLFDLLSQFFFFTGKISFLKAFEERVTQPLLRIAGGLEEVIDFIDLLAQTPFVLATPSKVFQQMTKALFLFTLVMRFKDLMKDFVFEKKLLALVL